jgi:hypothetical protein
MLNNKMPVKNLPAFCCSLVKYIKRKYIYILGLYSGLLPGDDGAGVKQ